MGGSFFSGYESPTPPLHTHLTVLLLSEMMSLHCVKSSPHSTHIISFPPQTGPPLLISMFLPFISHVCLVLKLGSDLHSLLVTCTILRLRHRKHVTFERDNVTRRNIPEVRTKPKLPCHFKQILKHPKWPNYANWGSFLHCVDQLPLADCCFVDHTNCGFFEALKWITIIFWQIQ